MNIKKIKRKIKYHWLVQRLFFQRTISGHNPLDAVEEE